MTDVLPGMAGGRGMSIRGLARPLCAKKATNFGFLKWKSAGISVIPADIGWMCTLR